MSSHLIVLPLESPGFYGINKEISPAILSSEWASDANNFIIDEGGRLGSRKGWAKQNSTPISGSPAVRSLYEYQHADGTKEIISAANGKLYTGTTTLTDITGTLTITNDHWTFNNFNGNIIGFQSGEDPIIYTGTGNFTLLHASLTAWAATTVYAAGDIRRATTGNTDRYFVCTTAGTSGGTEPTWTTTIGGTTADGTVVWTTYEFPKGTDALAYFGRIWTVDATRTVLMYSDLLIPYNFYGGSSGSIDLKAVWVYGMDRITAITAFNGHLVIFGEDSILIYSGADDPSTMSLVENIKGVGCINKFTVHSIGTDLLFLSKSGVRSLGRTIQEKSMPMNDLSKNIRQYLNTYLAIETVENIRACYYESDGLYLLSAPSADVVFCFNLKLPIEGVPRITTWTNISPSALCTTEDGTLYLGKNGYIGKYSGYYDDTVGYYLLYRSPWISFNNNLGRIDNVKILKNMGIHTYGYSSSTIEVSMYFDYGTTPRITTVSVPGASVAEYNIAEYNVDEYSSGLAYASQRIPLYGAGRIVQFNLLSFIEGSNLSIQKLLLYAKVGKM